MSLARAKANVARTAHLTAWARALGRVTAGDAANRDDAFVDGDHSTYGARRLADGWRRLGDVNRCGIDDVAAFVRPLGLQVRSDIDAGELERRYLTEWPGDRVSARGCMRVAHAIRA